MSKEGPERAKKLAARNMQFLIKQAGESKRALAAKGNAEPKTFNDLAKGKFDFRISALEKGAAAFGLEPWQLLVFDLNHAPAPPKDVWKLVELFSRANPEQRAALLQIAAAMAVG
jgi:hypothetical protein